MSYQTIEVPAAGEKITIQNGKLNVPDQPVLPFVEGDGTGLANESSGLLVNLHHRLNNGLAIALFGLGIEQPIGPASIGNREVIDLTDHGLENEGRVEGAEVSVAGNVTSELL